MASNNAPALPSKAVPEQWPITQDPSPSPGLPYRPANEPVMAISKAPTDPVQSKSHGRIPSEAKSLKASATKLIKPMLPSASPPPGPAPEKARTTPPPDAQPKDARSSSGLTRDTDNDSSHRSSSGPPTPPGNNYNNGGGLMPEPRGRSSSSQPANARAGSAVVGSRVASAAAAAQISRPPSSNDSQSPTRESRGRLRRSFLPGGRSRSHSRDPSSNQVKPGKAWILGQNADYNTSFLANGEKVPEMWNEAGNIHVHLHAKGTGGGACFKVPHFAITNSIAFNELMRDDEADSPTTSGRGRLGDSLSVEDATRRQFSPSPELREGESRMFLPVCMSEPGHVSQKDMERLISVRNLFAFLTGQPLVATEAHPTLFKVLLQVAALLQEYGFTNFDGTTFGESMEMSFSFFLEQNNLGDVRASREKNLEALVLGERLRSLTLYNEAFTHAAGKYSAIRELKSPVWDLLSPTTQQRLERAHLELADRQSTVNNRLESFEFPALFSGVAQSAMLFQGVKFATWRRAFNRMRGFVLNHYKTKFGSWPPKARNKKNPFTESGLNRLVLKMLYQDLCGLYDLLVDRESVTDRAMDQNPNDIDENDNSIATAMRSILTEFDSSSPPVLPPIPFDLPKLPDMASIQENYHSLPFKEKTKLNKGIQDYQLLLILNKAYDFETFKQKVPFLDEFKDFEYKEAKGKSVMEIADQRLGYWLFLYVVIQCLPMLVVDAPNLQYTEAVEYFLCQPPKGHAPWVSDSSVRKRWYEVPGGGGLVELSTDAVEFSIEGTYQRSYCWIAPKNWEAAAPNPAVSSPPGDGYLPPLQPPQSVFEDNDPSVSTRSESPTSGPPGAALRSRTSSPSNNSRSHAYRKSIAIGLEPVALPDNSTMPGSRLSSARVPSPAQRPPSTTMMDRNRSSGNMSGLNSEYSGSVPGSPTVAPSAQGGSTFDDILGVPEQKPKKKRMFF